MRESCEFQNARSDRRYLPTLRVSRPSRSPSDLLSVEQQYARGRRRRVGEEVDEQVGAARGDEEVTLAHHNGDDRRRAGCVAHKELPVVQAPREERAWLGLHVW